MASNLQFIKSVSSTSSVTNVSITDCFSADYDVYFLTCADLDLNGAGGEPINVRFINSGGSVISSAEYDYAQLQLRYASAFTVARGTASTSIQYGLGYSTDVNNGAMGASAYIYNPYDSSSYTFLTGQQTTDSGADGSKQIGVHKSAQQLSGVNIFVTNGTIERLSASIYGVK